MRLIRYLQNLSIGRTILWCYALWYGVNVWNHFEAIPRLWLTSIGLSGIIGTALLISTQSGSPWKWPDRWIVFRLFLMPFCVSSFAALVKDAHYLLIFPPSKAQNLAGLTCIAGFLTVVFVLKRRRR